MIIYKATNIVNGKCYIGQTVKTLEKRSKEHLWNAKVSLYNAYFYKAIRKYGDTSFDWMVLCVCESKEELDEMEYHYIQQYKMFSGVYNLTDGGDGSHGRVVSDETKEKISKANSGRDVSDETRKKLSIINSGINNNMYGRKHTEQTRLRISKSKIGTTASDETRKKLSIKSSGSNNPAAKSCVLRDPNGFIHTTSTQRELCDMFGLSESKVSGVIHGKRKSHKGWTKVNG